MRKKDKIIKQSQTRWYQTSTRDTLHKLGSTTTGLNAQAVRQRQKKYGLNRLPEKSTLSTPAILLGQFKSAFVYILLVATVVSFLLKETIDGSIILAAVIINVIVGFIQEYKAQQALQALARVVTTHARVKRADKMQVVPAVELVPGDIVHLQAGDKVPADMRLLETKELEIAEATLTGESEPVKKNTPVLKGELVLGDQTNMVFMSTIVTQGSALGIVVATGLETAIGEIASLVSDTREEATPLQQKLDKFSRRLAVLILGLSAVVFVVGLFFDHQVGEMFTTAVAIAVAAIPEGLVIAITVILAIGMRRILKERGLVKRLLAAETLGSTSVICSDKTGTLTAGQMRVAQIVGTSQVWQAAKLLDSPIAEAEYGFSLRIALLCNNANLLNKNHDLQKLKIDGSPTEQAMVLAGWQAGLDKAELEKQYPRLDEIPFDSEKKFMMTLHRFSDQENIVYLKGAPEVVLEMCDRIYSFKPQARQSQHQHLSLQTALKEKQQKQYEKMSAQGQRVLSVAYKKIPATLKSLQENNRAKDFVFVGFIGLTDPLRPDTKSVIERSRQAGVTTVMITGDHKLTAQAVAKELGMPHAAHNLMTGSKLDQISESQLKKLAPQISVYARVTPEHKLKIVKAWQDRGNVVAMTGDGVNDAPALKKADVGVALGSGTDVAQETADLILLDDDFKTIVSAIKQGRVIFDNIRKVILYLMANAFAEMGIIVIGLMFRWPLPVLASQILWVNLVNDILPALSLAQEPEESGIMNDPPQDKTQAVLDKPRKIIAITISIITWITVLGLFYFVWRGDSANLTSARTHAFVLLATLTLVYIFSLRSLRQPLWLANPLSNKYLVLSVLVGFGLLLIAVYIPFLQQVLKTTALSLTSWLIILAIAGGFIVIIEPIKLFFLKHKH